MDLIKVVQINRAFMVNVSNIQTIRRIQLSVTVNQVGLDNIVTFRILVHVHLIRYVLVFLPTINLSVSVREINLVLDAYFIMVFVNQI
jgi:hypothetical protein